MAPFDYGASGIRVRRDIPEAHATFWQRLAEPGAAWSGAQRVTIAAEVRASLSCELCARRKQALSPYGLEGEHEAHGSLPAAAVDAVHRIVTDAARLTPDYLARIAEEGVDDLAYVELLGVVVAVVSIDNFHRAMGFEPEPLPLAKSGEPSGYRPAEAEPGEAFVPRIPGEALGDDESDLYPRTRFVPNVITALSLVPDAVRDLKTLSAAHYIPMQQVPDIAADPGRAIDRSQIELVAGRVSAKNDCFY